MELQFVNTCKTAAAVSAGNLRAFRWHDDFITGTISSAREQSKVLHARVAERGVEGTWPCPFPGAPYKVWSP